jgi:DNA recombination protein RmuC
MDPLIVVVVAVSIAVVAIVSALAVYLVGNQRELSGRLAQIGDSAAAGQAELRRALDERLDGMARRLGDGLEQSATRTAETLGELRKHLNVIDEAQKNIATLSGQVVGLQDILANKQARGAFGEIQLHDLVQAALPPSAYAFQATLGNQRRVDCLVLLPNPPGPIAIDAKFPLESYNALRNAGDEASRVAAARAFQQDILKHVNDIAERYIIDGETAESALMFLPSEAVYAELHANFRNAVEQSFRKRVWIVSPTTLMATLNTVRAVLRDAQMREQAGLIQREVQAMLRDVQRLQDRVEKLQRHFGQVGDDVRQILVSTEKIVRRSESIENVQLGESATELAAQIPRLGSGDR